MEANARPEFGQMLEGHDHGGLFEEELGDFGDSKDFLTALHDRVEVCIWATKGKQGRKAKDVEMPVQLQLAMEM